MKTLTKDMVDFQISIKQEDISIEKYLSFELTGVDHSEYIKKVLDDDGYNPWLWCVVKVSALYKGLTSTNYLGGCCYESEDKFKADRYYQDMKDVAFDELKNQVDDILTDFV